MTNKFERFGRATTLIAALTVPTVMIGGPIYKRQAQETRFRAMSVLKLRAHREEVLGRDARKFTVCPKALACAPELQRHNMLESIDKVLGEKLPNNSTPNNE